CGSSEGDFSLQSWVDDLRGAIDHLISEVQPSGVWLVGTNTGGSISICVAADDPRVRGAALLSPRADFDDWAAQPRRFLEHGREIGAIRTPGF
ncbi:MAG TPA: alpha/beta hydrolase, partial [Ilumatobacteraceae bacterium]|nr:alpha/beta hydrolase [Ilumatobacteraceae bacterium]